MSFLKWLGGIISAVVIFWLTIGMLDGWKATRQSTPPTAPPSTGQTRPESIQPEPAAQDGTRAALEAMEWLRSRCGDGVQLVVPYGVGSNSDQAARTFQSALEGAGIRPWAMVINMPGAFSGNGSFSAEQFDNWRRRSSVAEGCLLVIVPHADRQGFALPRVTLELGDRMYSVVLPRGELSEVARRWDALFGNASGDADFIREIRASPVPLRVSVERI